MSHTAICRLSVMLLLFLIGSGTHRLTLELTVNLLLTNSHAGFSEENELRMITSCTCPGHEVVFECAVAGGGATIWQGTALEECNNGRIILRHSQFGSGHNISHTCGASGSVVGRATSVVSDSYTSQLTINVSQHLNGSIIECASDSGRQVGSRQILLTTGINCLLYTSPSPRDATLSRMPSSA